jgi:hypothetical protein
MNAAGGALARRLPLLEDRALERMQGRTPCPVATYRQLRREILGTDLRADHSEHVRRRFNAYYGVRRNEDWRKMFYTQFERAKTSSATAPDLFRIVLETLHRSTGRLEGSFASKLVATLRPEYPIIDSVVRGWLSHDLDSPRFGGGVASTVDYYGWLSDVMLSLSATNEAKAWRRRFLAAFPTPPGEPPVSAIKQLDFLIWAGADR